MTDPCTRLKPPENGIGWTPDRFRVELWFPSCSITVGPLCDGQTYTWEQATEVARRRIEAAGDPVYSVRFVAADPLNDGTD